MRSLRDKLYGAKVVEKAKKPKIKVEKTPKKVESKSNKSKKTK